MIRRYAPRLVVDGGAGWSSTVQRALPSALAAARGRQLTPTAGQVITVGGLRFEVLWPPARRPGERLDGNPNDRAVVARLEAGSFSMLLSADAESNITGALALEPVDVLKVAHHGSADPGLPALLTRLKPRVAAIEVGRDNRYGHPTAETRRGAEAGRADRPADRPRRHGAAAFRRRPPVGAAVSPRADTVAAEPAAGLCWGGARQSG